MPQHASSSFPARDADLAQKQLLTDASGALIGAGSSSAAALNGEVFTASNVLTTPVTTTVALATTYVGLCLSNPAASGKNLILVRASGAFVVAPSTITTLGLIAGYVAAGIVTHTTPLVVHNALIGAATPAAVGKVDSACTLVGTPYWADVLGQAPTATTSLSFSRAYEGEIVIPPGAYVAIGTNIAGPASGFAGAFMWAEVDAE